MPEETELPFEAALSQLEEIVAALERGEPDLTAALAKYETGVRLLTQCYSLLERAERAVELLTGVDAEGNPVTAPFDATATILIEQAALGSVSAAEGSGESPAQAPTASKPAGKRRAKQATEPESELDRFDPPF